jgi:membrane protease YdiL (CAAX protease family)
VSFTTPSPALVAVGERRRGGIVLIICALGFLVGQFVASLTGLVALWISGSSLSLGQVAALPKAPWWWISSTLIGLWIGFSMSVIVSQSLYRIIDTARAFKFKAFDLVWVPMAIGLQILIGIVYSVFGVKGVSKPTDKIIGTSSGWSLALICLLTVVGAPFFEELFFRGALLIGLRDVLRTASVPVTAVLAISLDGVLFGLAHGEWVQLPGLAFVGMVLAWAYWFNGRLWPNMILHSSFNALALVEVINFHPHA